MKHWLDELEESTNTGCWEYTIDSKKLNWSDQTYNIHKVKIGTVIKTEDAISFYHEDDRELIQKLFNDCIENKKTYKRELRIIDTTGKVIKVEASGKPLIDKNGKLLSVFGTFKDLTEKTLLKEKIGNITRHYNNFYNTLSKFFLITDTDKSGTITYVNDNFCEFSGFEREELIGKSHRKISSKKNPKSTFDQLWKEILSGNPWEGLICNRKKNGEYFWQQTLVFPKIDGNGQIDGFSSIKTDVTDKILTQERLQIEIDKNTFAAQLAAVGEISTGVAHEIANPLTIISFKNNYLKNIYNDKEKLESTQLSISKSVARINKIIKGLQRLSRRTEDNVFETVGIHHIFDETLTFCRELLKKNHIKLEFENPPQNIYIECDEIKISQIILNLINNARDAINESKSSREKWINISCKNNNKYIELRVSDSGDGIPLEIRDSFMQSFVTSKKLGKGTGLGLALVNRFVTEHQGKFYLDEKASNTCFVIEIPKKRTI